MVYPVSPLATTLGNTAVYSQSKYITPPRYSQPQAYNNPLSADSFQRVQGPLPIYHFSYVMPWQNRLKEMFHNREALIYALNLRTFAAEDKNGDGKIDPTAAENGTFLKAIKRLPELKAMGINTIHMLPIQPIGQIGRLGKPGAPGSLYAPLTLDSINGEFDDPSDPKSVIDEAKAFVEAAHKNGIHVMADIPSCGSQDLEQVRPSLFARDEYGRTLTPTTWVDIRMFVKDSPELRNYYEKLFKLLAEDIGVDGFRVDVARARSLSFWRHFLKKYPDKAWLAESYTEELASPMKNVPRDIPADLLRIGFDSVYGQFHIFNDMNGQDYQNYLMQNKAMVAGVGHEKSLIGSFMTHDDPSIMRHGGAMYSKLVGGLMLTQPDTNPYILDGYFTGYPHSYDIFNWRKPVTGNHPDIGEFFQGVAKLREQYGALFRQGTYVPLQVNNPNVIAFVRQLGNKSVLVLANKNVNAEERALIRIPSLKVNQKLKNIAPDYGDKSMFIVDDGQIHAYPLAPGRFYMFDIEIARQQGY